VDPHDDFAGSHRVVMHLGIEKDGSDLGERSSIAVLPLMLLEKATDDQGVCLGFADALCFGSIAG
jgi:hypothetical protein